MTSEPLKLLKTRLEANFGELGVRIYQKSILKSKVSENPSRKEINLLMSNLEKIVAKLYGNNKSKLIFDDLRKELIEFDRFFDHFFNSKIKDALDNFFEIKGIPRYCEIKQIAKFLISNGYEQNEKTIIKILKQFSNEKIISALNGSIINNEIKLFLKKNPVYTQVDVEGFINYLKANKLKVNSADLKGKIEKERLFRKFNYMARNENEEDKIFRQYIELLYSSKPDDYKYINVDKNLSRIISIKYKPDARLKKGA